MAIPASTPRSSLPLRGIAQGDGGVIRDGVVACAGETIVFVGTKEASRREVELASGGRRLDARGGVVLPGFVDPHTHLPFAGWRAEEFEKRLAGASYREIAASGGGILSTVRTTRAASIDELAALVRGRLDAMLLAGTTTVEAKSGYGLTLESEIAILRALALAADHTIEIHPTFLGAHVIAPEYRDGRRSEYVRLIVEEMIPRVAEEGLARACDVFIDDGAFTLDEGRRILEAARARGLALRVHAEQLSRTGAAALAASMGALSIDHLEHLLPADIDSLASGWSDASTGPVAVLLPGAAFFLREKTLPPARALIAAGIPVALATDFNPGTSPCLAMPPILNLACVLLGMTPDEAIVAATRNAAAALGIADRVGSLAPGRQADIAIFDLPDRRHLAYRFGPIPCSGVVKRGKIVVEEGRLAGAAAARAARSANLREKLMLIDLNVKSFLGRLASEEPTPGGGSASALAGAQAAALLEMVIAVTLKSEKYTGERGFLDPIRAKALSWRTDLTDLVDRDAAAYESVVAAMRLPKETDEQKALRKAAREKALLFAAEVPLKTAELAAAIAGLAADAAPHINPNAASDLLVAALLAETALGGAAANVRINLSALKSESFASRANERLDAWTRETTARVAAIRERFASAL